MGIIYDAVRKNYTDFDDGKKEMEEIDAISFYNIISFRDFIDVLELYTDDDLNIISKFLLERDEFLKLDFYTRKPTTVDSDAIDFITHKYDAYFEDEMPTVKDFRYPTEKFLEYISEFNNTNGYGDLFFWKIDDLLRLNCMLDLGLNIDILDHHLSCIYSSSPRTVLFLSKHNEELLEQLNDIYNNNEMYEINELLDELKDSKEKINNLEIQIESMSIKFKSERLQSDSENDRPMHPRTANNASKIIAALASEMLKIDLTKPYSVNSNEKIKSAIERQGNTLSNDVIGYWLNLAHKNSI